MKRIFLSFLITILLISCSPVSSDWSCKSNLNGSCKNIREIDSGYNKEEMDNNNNLEKKLKQIKNSELQENKINKSSFDDFRSKESVARVVFTPYVDEAGNRHDVSTVYYLEQKAEWKK